MASIRREFTDELKAEAVQLVTVEGHSARQVAKDLGIHESLPVLKVMEVAGAFDLGGRGAVASCEWLQG